MLIQCLWRCFAADKSFHSDATWRIYVQNNDEVGNNNNVSMAPSQLGKVSSTFFASLFYMFENYFLCLVQS